MIRYTFRKNNETPVTLLTFSDKISVHVDACEGLIGKPSFKSVENFNWRYLHGTVPDLRNMRYQDREIVMSCWMKARSKQELVENLNAFLAYFDHDGYLWLKVDWTGNDGNPIILPDPHASKGLYYMVYLQKVDIGKKRMRFGMQYVRFTMTFIDPMPSKRVYRIAGTSGEGIEYEVSSDSEIDIYCEGGQSATELLEASGHLDVPNARVILVCGDVAHADVSIEPTNRSDTVTQIYEEI